MESRKNILKQIIIFALLFHFGYSYTIAQSAGFIKVGEIKVRNDNNQDEIKFNNQGISLSQIQFIVKQGAVGFDKIVLTKVDGSQEELAYKMKLLNDTESKIFTVGKITSNIIGIKIWHSVRPNDKARPIIEIFGNNK